MTVARTGREDRIRALVWKRSDFRETSRLITFITAEHGKLTTLAKGGHRPGSQCLGRIDFLNLVDLKISSGNLPILHRVRLIHEHRRLRDPIRYRAASYLTEIFDPAILFGRSDPGLFELLAGGLLMLERCPYAAIPCVLAGLELRFLFELGLRPPLLACHRCGASSERGPLFPARIHPGLCCRTHAPRGARAVPADALRWLDRISHTPGKQWSGLPPAPAAVAPLLGRGVAAAVEKQPMWRAAAFA